MAQPEPVTGTIFREAAPGRETVPRAPADPNAACRADRQKSARRHPPTHCTDARAGILSRHHGGADGPRGPTGGQGARRENAGSGGPDRTGKEGEDQMKSYVKAGLLAL